MKDALVLASIGEYSEYEHLGSFTKLLKDELIMDDYWILNCIYVKKTIEINERLLYDKVLFYPSWRN